MELKMERVIKGLECCAAMSGDECRECPYSKECRDTDLPYGMPHLAADALALLKIQEPIAPKLDVDEWRCGNCDHKLEHQELLGNNVLFHEQYNYCPNCGKAVKWDD